MKASLDNLRAKVANNTTSLKIKEFTFECISDAQTEIKIFASEEISAKWRLEFHVKDASNFRLKK